MNKKEMIDEMASDMDFACVELSKEQRIEIARTLINLDYRKMTVPIKITTIGYGKENGCYYADIIATGQEFPQRIYFQASLVEREVIQRETAEEIIQDLYSEASSNISNTVELTTFQIKQIAEKYGAKVEE